MGNKYARRQVSFVAKGGCIMIAEYLTRRNAEIYASELAQFYGPDVRFDVVGMPDPVFGGTVWYVLGTGTVDGQMFAQYARAQTTAQSRGCDENAHLTGRGQQRGPAMNIVKLALLDSLRIACLGSLEDALCS
jgi:hypothetical protein